MLGRAKFKRGLVFLAALTMLLSVFPVAGAGAKTFVQPFKKSGVDSYVPRRYI